MSDNNPYQYPGQGQVSNGSPAAGPMQNPPGDLRPDKRDSARLRYAPEKPTAVTVFGILNCVFGGLGILCTPFSILGLFIGDLIPMSEMNPLEMTPGYKMFLLVTSILGIGFAAWLLSLGIGLLKFKSWARRGSVIYAWIAIIWGIAGVGINMAALSQGWMSSPEGQLPAMVGGMCGSFIGLIYPVLLLVFMLTDKVKQAFR